MFTWLLCLGLFWRFCQCLDNARVSSFSMSKKKYCLFDLYLSREVSSLMLSIILSNFLIRSPAFSISCVCEFPGWRQIPYIPTVYEFYHHTDPHLRLPEYHLYLVVGANNIPSHRGRGICWGSVLLFLPTLGTKYTNRALLNHG